MLCCFRRPLRIWLCVALAFLLVLPVSAKTYVFTNGKHTITSAPAAADPPVPAETATPEVFLIHHGKKTRVFSRHETVGLLLNRLGITLSATDVVSHSPDTPVERGMHLRIDSVITRQETYAVSLPYDTIRYEDPTLPAGETRVLIKGQEGELLRRADVTYRNGTESGRKILEETLTIPPIGVVVAFGTGAIPEEMPEQTMPVIKDGYIIMPTGEILTYYKTDNVTATGYTHTDEGCDLVTSTGTTVRYGTAAVDPRFIPYGTRMLIVSHDKERYYGIATAEDCGGAIKRDRMDLYFPSHQECIEFGKRRCTIYFLG